MHKSKLYLFFLFTTILIYSNSSRSESYSYYKDVREGQVNYNKYLLTQHLMMCLGLTWKQNAYIKNIIINNKQLAKFIIY